MCKAREPQHRYGDVVNRCGLGCERHDHLGDDRNDRDLHDRYEFSSKSDEYQSHSAANIGHECSPRCDEHQSYSAADIGNECLSFSCGAESSSIPDKHQSYPATDIGSLACPTRRFTFT
jgi:hypothetical protein